jgi:hypothetical protein
LRFLNGPDRSGPYGSVEEMRLLQAATIPACKQERTASSPSRLDVRLVVEGSTEPGFTTGVGGKLAAACSGFVVSKEGSES